MKKIISLLDSQPLFLLLVPAYVLVHLEKVFFGLIRHQFVLKQAAILWFATFLIIYLSGKLFSQKEKAAAMAFTVIMTWCYFGPIKNALHSQWPGSVIQGYAFLIPSAFFLIMAAYTGIKKYHGTWSRLYIYLNMLWIIFILADFAVMAQKSISATALSKKYAFSLPAIAIPDSAKPDIFYVVFDGYGRYDVLRSMGFDNSRLVQQLESMQFRVISGSESNYNLTPFSIGSTLNMCYIDEADTSKKYYLNDYLPALNIVKQNGLFPFLRSNGYDILNYSIFDFQDSPNAIPVHDIWDLNNLYLQHNAALKIYKDISWHMFRGRENLLETTKDEMKTRTQYDSTVFLRLMGAAEVFQSKPRFIYGHFYFPHSPNCYDSVGHLIPFKPDMSALEDAERYTGEIRYVNRKMYDLARSIIHKRQRPLVIIFQGDHGYRTFGAGQPGNEFKNFCAVYFSNGKYSDLSDSLTNVNVFRTVMNAYFSISQPQLPNQTFYLKYY